ncbi:MAG: succinate dehydrogenase cytochrome b subunit [Bacteriovoracaceae bacterium]|jgi:succinate dehydrogenase / fumarate reductase, cytochrome b subunit|nr:succinate dehydrogenase cytochrome b subunit [Bacteriovoracaceae bacterium]
MSCRFCTYLQSSIGKKQVMALTGLALCGFLVVHLLGNLLIFVGPKAFNSYAHALITNPLIIPMEAGLALLFFSHIALGVKLTAENKKARPKSYYMKTNSGRGATFASSTMPITGVIILVFLVLHLINFRFGEFIGATYNGVDMRDLYIPVVQHFSNPAVVLWYLFAHLALAVHVSHGLASAVQSFGFSHPRYSPILKIIAKAYAFVIFVGFSSIPVWIYLTGGVK